MLHWFSTCWCYPTAGLLLNSKYVPVIHSFIHSFLGRWANHDHLTSKTTAAAEACKIIILLLLLLLLLLLAGACNGRFKLYTQVSHQHGLRCQAAALATNLPQSSI